MLCCIDFSAELLKEKEPQTMATKEEQYKGIYSANAEVSTFQLGAKKIN